MPGTTGSVGRLHVTTPGERELCLSRSFAASRRAVFECWTSPALLRRWLTGPEGWQMVACEVELRPGGAYRFAWRHAEGQEIAMGGTWREVEPPARLVGTQLFDPDPGGGEILSTLELSDQDGRSLVVNRLLYPSRAARDGALAGGMTQGVVANCERLDGVLASLAAGAA